MEMFKLLDLQQDNKTEVSAEALAGRMSKLSLNLCDLGMHEEVLGIQTMCVVIHHGLVQQYGHSLMTSCKLAQSLNNLSTCLPLINNQEEAMQTVKESVDLYWLLKAHNLEPHHAESLHNFSYCLSKLGC